jgi:hypothetical protein
MNAQEGRNVIGPILTSLPAEKLAVIALHEAASKVLVRPQGATFCSVALSVGDAVEAEHNVMFVKEQEIPLVRSCAEPQVHLQHCAKYIICMFVCERISALRY